MIDIIVIGGGIIGRACAVSLAEQGARVVMIDAQREVRAASQATTGVLMPPMSPSTTPLHVWARQSAAMYPAVFVNRNVDHLIGEMLTRVRIAPVG